MKTLSYAFKYLLKLRGNNVIKLISITMGLFLGWVFLAKIVYVESYNKSFPDAERIYRVDERVTLPDRGDQGRIHIGARRPGPERRIPGNRNRYGHLPAFPFADTRRTSFRDKHSLYRHGVFRLVQYRSPVRRSGAGSSGSGQPVPFPKNGATDLRRADLIGQMLEEATGTHYRVAGIFEDLPDNTDVRCEGIVSFDNVKKNAPEFGMGRRRQLYGGT